MFAFLFSEFDIIIKMIHHDYFLCVRLSQLTNLQHIISWVVTGNHPLLHSGSSTVHCKLTHSSEIILYQLPNDDLLPIQGRLVNRCGECICAPERDLCCSPEVSGVYFEQQSRTGYKPVTRRCEK